MFMQRLITALILVPLVLAGIWYAPLGVIGFLVLALMMGASMELWQLLPVEHLVTKIAFILIMCLALMGCGIYYKYWLDFGLIFWVFIVMAVVTFPASQKLWGHAPVVAFASLIVLPLFAQSMMHIYIYGKAFLIYLLFLVWAADVGAYLVGKFCGSHKLISKVSPGKSWEGLLGGVVLAMVIATVGYYFFMPFSAVKWFGLSLATVVISIFGDLFISILKRRCQLKDTGALFPGHGGILDRIDSLIAAAPLFYFGLGPVNMVYS